MILELQGADGVGDALNSVLYWMCEVIHGVNAPFVSCVVVGDMGYPVDDGITHVDVGGCHVYFGTEYFFSVCVFSGTHGFEKLQVLFYASITVRAFFARLRQGSTVGSDFFRRQVTDESFSFFNELDRRFVHGFKVIGSKEQAVFPVCTQPLDVGFDGLYELHFFFGGVGVIEAHVEFAVVFLGKAVV